MRLIGFDFTKVSGEKASKFKEQFSTNTNIDIAGIKEEKADFLKDLEVIKVSFKFEVIYNSKEKKEVKLGEVALAGDLIFSADEKEAKELLQSWKKKDEKAVPAEFRVPLFNLIMRKCTPKALDLEDSLGLPFHFPFPQIKAASGEKK
jgi:hypothetical protein